eukprot:GHVP01037998.1.p1 GENE.GHVP01037998.1~~GHVP01037998.1.p1  ORF type:complete len:753 (-),score=149.51 GHVP01037998.1:3663-5921(-)
MADVSRIRESQLSDEERALFKAVKSAYYSQPVIEWTKWSTFYHTIWRTDKWKENVGNIGTCNTMDPLKAIFAALDEIRFEHVERCVNDTKNLLPTVPKSPAVARSNATSSTTTGSTESRTCEKLDESDVELIGENSNHKSKKRKRMLPPKRLDWGSQNTSSEVSPSSSPEIKKKRPHLEKPQPASQNNEFINLVETDEQSDDEFVSRLKKRRQPSARLSSESSSPTQSCKSTPKKRKPRKSFDTPHGGVSEVSCTSVSSSPSKEESGNLVLSIEKLFTDLKSHNSYQKLLNPTCSLNIEELREIHENMNIKSTEEGVNHFNQFKPEVLSNLSSKFRLPFINIKTSFQECHNWQMTLSERILKSEISNQNLPYFVGATAEFSEKQVSEISDSRLLLLKLGGEQTKAAYEIFKSFREEWIKNLEEKKNQKQQLEEKIKAEELKRKTDLAKKAEKTKEIVEYIIKSHEKFPDNPFAVLPLSRTNRSSDALKKLKAALVLLTHPDKAPSASLVELCTEAFKVVNFSAKKAMDFINKGQAHFFEANFGNCPFRADGSFRRPAKSLAIIGLCPKNFDCVISESSGDMHVEDPKDPNLKLKTFYIDPGDPDRLLSYAISLEAEPSATIRLWISMPVIGITKQLTYTEQRKLNFYKCEINRSEVECLIDGLMVPVVWQQRYGAPVCYFLMAQAVVNGVGGPIKIETIEAKTFDYQLLKQHKKEYLISGFHAKSLPRMNKKPDMLEKLLENSSSLVQQYVS